MCKKKKKGAKNIQNNVHIKIPLCCTWYTIRGKKDENAIYNVNNNHLEDQTITSWVFILTLSTSISCTMAIHEAKINKTN